MTFDKWKPGEQVYISRKRYDAKQYRGRLLLDAKIKRIMKESKDWTKERLHPMSKHGVVF